MGEAASVGKNEPEKPRRRRRRSRSGGSERKLRGRMRLVYFGLASLWGSIAGTVAVVLALAAIDRPIEPHPVLAVGVAIAALVAVAGGAVAANAYRQASSRG